MKVADENSWRQSLLTDRCDFPQSITREQVNSLRDYIKVMEFLISDVEKEDEKALNRHAETIQKEHREEFLAYNRTPWDDIGQPVSNIFPNSSLFCRGTTIETILS